MEAQAVLSRPLWAIWSFEPSVVTGSIAVALLYAYFAFWSRGDTGQKAPLGQIWLFYLGLVVFFVTLESAIDVLGEEAFFFVHMLQHLIIIYLAAPLFVAGLRGQLPVFPFLTRAWTWLSRPVATVVVFVGILYAWHTPYLYDWALRNDTVHAMEHVLFLVSAMLLWQWILGPIWPGTLPEVKPVTRLVLIAATDFLLAVLGLFLAFYPHPIYTFYAQLHPRPLGISALQDQLYGGIAMVMAGLLAILTMVALLEDSETT